MTLIQSLKGKRGTRVSSGSLIDSIGKQIEHRSIPDEFWDTTCEELDLSNARSQLRNRNGGWKVQGTTSCAASQLFQSNDAL